MLKSGSMKKLDLLGFCIFCLLSFVLFGCGGGSSGSGDDSSHPVEGIYSYNSNTGMLILTITSSSSCMQVGELGVFEVITLSSNILQWMDEDDDDDDNISTWRRNDGSPNDIVGTWVDDDDSNDKLTFRDNDTWYFDGIVRCDDDNDGSGSLRILGIFCGETIDINTSNVNVHASSDEDFDEFQVYTYDNNKMFKFEFQWDGPNLIGIEFRGDVVEDCYGFDTVNADLGGNILIDINSDTRFKGNFYLSFNGDNLSATWDVERSGGGGGGSGEDDDDQSLTLSGESGNQVSLNGDWDTGCLDMGGGELVRWVTTISGSSFSQKEQGWIDSASCAETADFTLIQSGTFVLGNETTAGLNGLGVTATEMDIVITSFEATIHNPDLVDNSNAEKECGFDDWLVDTPKELFGTNCSPEANDKEVLYVDDTANPDILYKGDEDRPDDANGYPSEIDPDTPQRRL